MFILIILKQFLFPNIVLRSIISWSLMLLMISFGNHATKIRAESILTTTRHDTINDMSNAWAVTGCFAFFRSAVTPFHALHWMTSFIFIGAIFRLLTPLFWVFIWKLSNIHAYKFRKKNVIRRKVNNKQHWFYILTNLEHLMQNKLQWSKRWLLTN